MGSVTTNFAYKLPTWPISSEVQKATLAQSLLPRLRAVLQEFKRIFLLFEKALHLLPCNFCTTLLFTEVCSFNTTFLHSGIPFWVIHRPSALLGTRRNIMLCSYQPSQFEGFKCSPPKVRDSDALTCGSFNFVEMCTSDCAFCSP